jgi:hypothetical protein
MKYTRNLLNENLIKENSVSDEQVKNLLNLYEEIDDLFHEAHESSGDKVYFAERLEKLEFLLQENWNFPKDKLYHTWWNKFKDCTCPKMDNSERFGVEKIYSKNCPYHGWGNE